MASAIEEATAEDTNEPGVAAEKEDPAVPALPPALPPIESAGKDKEEDGEEGDADDGTEPPSKKAKIDEDTGDKEDSLSLTLSAAPPVSLANDFRGGQESWNAMLYQLLLYKAQRGDLNIPNNDTSYRLLHNWVQTQRKHYKLYQENKTSSTFLNADRIAVLDAVDFQWNVRGDTFWQKNYDALVAYKNENGDARVPRLYAKNPKLGEWVTEMRRQWKAKSEGKPNTMTDERKQKLDDLGFVWKVRDRADWNDRYEQLLEFKKENGHCIVPQHYIRNRALGKWVAKQREQYRFYREGKHSFLTEERIDLLKSVGFVWQIKGRGANKKGKEGKGPGKAKGGTKRALAEPKSLAKMEEEEEKAKSDTIASAIAVANKVEETMLKSPPELGIVAEAIRHSEELNKGEAGAGPKEEDNKAAMPGLPPPNQAGLPPISQEQLLQANMAAIAAHASSNQNMVADLAAALRLGGAGEAGAGAGGMPGGAGNVPLGDPRAAAALRAAQFGGDGKGSGSSFTRMI